MNEELIVETITGSIDVTNKAEFYDSIYNNIKEPDHKFYNLVVIDGTQYLMNDYEINRIRNTNCYIEYINK